MAVRDASEADRPALDELWRQIDALHAEIQPSFFRRPPGPRAERHLQTALRDPQRHLLVAEDERGIVGTVQLRIYDAPATAVPCRRGYVEDLVVDSARRGSGVGRALMRAAAARAREAGAEQLLLTVWRGNEDARRFYERLGYHELSHVLAKDL